MLSAGFLTIPRRKAPKVYIHLGIITNKIKSTLGKDIDLNHVYIYIMGVS